jgi:hypothetical protein
MGRHGEIMEQKTGAPDILQAAQFAKYLPWDLFKKIR